MKESHEWTIDQAARMIAYRMHHKNKRPPKANKKSRFLT
jgi:hypothetical protein